MTVFQVYKAQGRFSEALQNYEEALKIKRARLGDAHPELAISLWSMADVLDAMERWSEAKQLYLKAFDMSQQVLGADHSHTRAMDAAVKRLAAAGH